MTIDPQQSTSSDEARQTPEQFLSLIRNQRRGRLKVYLGFAAGVGKTYEMLQEGQRLKRQGVDVAIGIVETHGRVDTAAQIGELEQIPRRKIEYHSVVLQEMDLDAILERRPTVVLVDELAHTNAPGSRNVKRYQDVAELLHAGINVISTLNVQHLESLHDIVEQATGVKVKERIPDHVISAADQLVNVDVSAEDLRERLQAGKVYPKERIDTALENFFTFANLTRLRELAMGEIVYRLDRSRLLQDGGSEVGGIDRVMVCLSSRGPDPAALLRKTSRIAERLGAPWYAVYVQLPRESLESIDAATQRRITNSLTLAQELGGTPLTFKGSDLVETIRAFAKEYGITHIVLGRPNRPWYRRWFGQSVLERLFRQVREIDVTIVGSVKVPAKR
jgi:two-component system sensor histidine kinase KdpD